jgi:hypothetical protein
LSLRRRFDFATPLHFGRTEVADTTPRAAAPVTKIKRRRSTHGLRAACASAGRTRHHAIGMGDMNVHLMAALRAFADAHARHQFRPRPWRLELNHLTQGWFSLFASVLC